MGIPLQRDNPFKPDQLSEGMIHENKVSQIGRNARDSVGPMDPAPRLVEVAFYTAVPSVLASLKRPVSAIQSGNDDGHRIPETHLSDSPSVQHGVLASL